jgi:ATP-binding cassette subfamily C (CFTR/MRP) protein 4
LRKEELGRIRRVGFLKAVNGPFFGLSSKIVVFGSILTFVLMGGDLTAERVFVSLALYNNVRVIMTLCFPMAVAQLSEASVTIRRIQGFLLLELCRCGHHSAG